MESLRPNRSIYRELSSALPSNVTMHNVRALGRRRVIRVVVTGQQLGTEGRSTLTAEGHPGWVSQEVKKRRSSTISTSPTSDS